MPKIQIDTRPKLNPLKNGKRSSGFNSLLTLINSAHPVGLIKCAQNTFLNNGIFELSIFINFIPDKTRKNCLTLARRIVVNINNIGAPAV